MILSHCKISHSVGAHRTFITVLVLELYHIGQVQVKLPDFDSDMVRVYT